MGVYDSEPPAFLNADIDSILADFRSKPITPYTPTPEPAEEDGEFVKSVKRGVEGLKSAAYGAAGLAGSALGVDAVRDWGYQGFQEHEQEAAKHAGRVQTLEDIKGIGDLPDYVIGTFGSLVPSIFEGAVTAAAGSLIGSAAGPAGTVAGGVGGFVGKQATKSMIRKLARKYVKDGMEKGLAREAAEKAVGLLPAKKIAANIGAKAGIVAGTAPIEAGGMWGEGMQQGKDNPWSAAVFGTLSGLSELAGGEAELIDIFTNPARQAAKGNIIKRIGMEMSKTIPQEAAQEATQETLAIINRKVVDPSFDMFGEEARSRVLNSAAAGAIGGVAFGAAGGIKGPLTRATETVAPPVTPQPEMEPDPFRDEQPPHYSETLDKEEQERQGSEAAGSEENEAAPGGTSAGQDIGATDTVLSQDEQENQKPRNGQPQATAELSLDEAREWAASSGKHHLMRIHGEPEADYHKRILKAYQNRDQKPPAQPADTGPKYASVELVNPDTGEVETVKPEEVANRLHAGWRPLEQQSSPITHHSSLITDLNTVTGQDRETLQSAMERARSWEHHGTDGGRSNREDIYPWLSSWPTTTPGEVSKAIGKFLEGKKLGEVQQRLVQAALEYERENPVPFDVLDETAEQGEPEAETPTGEKTLLSGAMRAKANAYAQAAGMDLEGLPEQEIAAFVKQYRKWKWAKRQEEHFAQKIEKTREPKALERQRKALAEATRRRKELEPKGGMRDGLSEVRQAERGEEEEVSPVRGEAVEGKEEEGRAGELKARLAEARRKHIRKKLAEAREPKERERLQKALARLEAERGSQQGKTEEETEVRQPVKDIRKQRVEEFKKKYGYAEDAEKTASQNAPETVFEGKAIPEPGPENPAKTPATQEERPAGAVPPASGEKSAGPSGPDMASWKADFGIMGEYTFRPVNRAPLPEGGTLVSSSIHPVKVTVSKRFAERYSIPRNYYAFRISVVKSKDGGRFAQVEYMGDNERNKEGIVEAHFNKMPQDALESREFDKINRLAEKAWSQAKAQNEPALFTEGKEDEFITAPDGGVDFGEITGEIGNEIRREAAPIRLRKEGMKHIEARHGKEILKEGYTSVQEFVKEVAREFNVIFTGRASTLVLVKRNGSDKILYIELAPSSDTSFYDIKSAMLVRPDFLKSKKPLWERAQSSQPGGGSPSAVSGQSGSSDKTVSSEDSNVKDNADSGKIEDFGEKIGGARKDTAEKKTAQVRKAKEKETSPAWKKRFVVAESVKVPGQFSIIDTKEGRYGFSSGGQTFASKEEAESAVPVYAVAKTHQVYQNADKTWSIWKRVGDRKRIKVVNHDFEDREDAMRHMVKNAVSLLENKTSFGEEILPVPEIAVRTGEERRTGPATPEMFMETFAPRGIEFGNWNNQDERQQVMDHAYDGLLDLAEVLGVPPKALMLNGELAIAFGARGQGLAGAKAHYELDYGVINLTKMKGAGSLAHEWFHAFDHYLGRLDGKASSEKEQNKRGDQVYKTKGRGDHLSHGASYKSRMRAELLAAYTNLIRTMYKKAEQYVEDTDKTEKFVGAARNNLKKSLDSIRADLSRDLSQEYTWRKSKKGLAPASSEQLAEFDRLAATLVEGGDLATSYRSNNPTAPANSRAAFAGRNTNDTLESLSRILKAVRNRSGFNAERTGTLDRLRTDMVLYGERLKMLREAQTGTEKTKQAPTAFAMEAKKMDQARSSDYWSEPHEMAARAFAAYVEDKVAEQGGQSDFLVYHAHGGIILPMIDGFVARPYPEGQERKALNAAFDTFVKSIRTEETDKGVVMFALRPDMSNKEALPGLVERGLREFKPGMKYPDFARRMKAALVDMWDRFKVLMLKVWHEVRAKFLDDRGSFNYREMKVPAGKNLFERVGVTEGNIFADYVRLQEKHPEYFTTPEDVRRHVEYVVENPSDILPATKDEYTLLVRSDGQDRAAVVEFVKRGGKYRVRSAYILEEGQLEVKREKALHAVSKPNPPENLGENIEEGGGVPSGTLRAEPSSDKSIASADDAVKFAVNATSYGLPAADIQAAFEPVYKNMPQAPPWRVVQTAAELPQRALDHAARRGMPQRFLQAVYLGDEVVYVADHFSSIEEAKEILLEEVVAHHGLRGIMSRDSYEKHMLHAAIWYANKRNEEWKALAEGYGLDLKTREGRIEAAEEMLGRDARTGKDSTMLSRIIAAVKEFLRSIGFDVGYGEAEIRELLGKARRYIEGKEAPYEKEGQGGIDYGAMLRKLREQGITDEQLQAFLEYQPGGAMFAAEPQVLSRIDSVLDAATRSGNEYVKVQIGEASQWLIKRAEEAGIDIKDYSHIVDSSAVRHVKKSHGDAIKEKARGQIAVTDDDLRMLPFIVAEPDKIAFGTKNRLGKDQIVYLKALDDGSTLYFEEIRTGRRELAAVTVRKYPATMSADSILATLNPNVRNDGGSEIIVRNGPEKSRDMRFALALLEDVKSQIIDKSVSLNTTEREVLEADRAKALEAIGETVKDYDEPGRMLFRAFYESDQDQAPGVVPYNPERGHYAAGEDLKGSWWTTSLATAREIAWSKARQGKKVKVVALPVDRLPNGNLYIQNTNPPGMVYDLFIGLPADVPMKDVREMPVDSGIRYALADGGLARYTEHWGSAGAWKSLARLLNPLDWSRFRDWIDEHTPVHIMNAIGHWLRTPVEAAEADRNKSPFVDTALDREQNKNSLILKLFGWFGGKEKPAGFVERLTKEFTNWGAKDLSTAWGVIADNYARLSGGDREGVNRLIYRGDLDGKAWGSYDMVKDDKNLAGNLPSEAAFKVYKAIRNHIDTVVADTIENAIRESGKENGLSMDEVEKHISTFRNNMARHPGWMPRNHGEGDWQVNVYQRITGLKWDIVQYRTVKHYQFIKKNGDRVDTEKHIDALSAYLPYFPSRAVADEIKTLARRFGLAYEHEEGTGRQRVYVDQGAPKRLGKAVQKLKQDLAKDGLPEARRFELQSKLAELEDALFFVKDNSPQKQIRFFVKQAAKIIGKLELQNSVNIRQAEENLKQALEDKESAAEIKRLKDELKRLGDGSIKVKVYMKLQTSRSRANRHKKEVLADLKKAMPKNYLDWAAYETRVEFDNRLSEATYGDMQNDFAMEQAQLQAIDRAASKQDITKTEAAGIRHQLVQSLAEVLMARGAGAHRIQRAPYLIEGYETEAPIQLYQDYMTSTAGMISKAKYACAQFENFRYAPREVKPWAEQYIRDTLRNMGAADRISANLRSVASLAYLGFKVSSMVINATQPWTLGIAELGKHTKKSPLLAIAKAQKDIFTGNLSDREKEIFSSEIWKEQEQNTVIREMTGAGEGTAGKVSQAFHTLTGKAMFGFQEVEMLNRKTVILAAYRSFTADGMEHEEALEKALRVNRRVNFEMSRANLPGFAQKPLGRTVYALQSFLWNNWNWVYNNLTSGKKEDMAAMLRYAAAMAIIGGAAALPGWDELDKLYQILFGESPKLAFRKWTRQHARQYGTLGELVNGFAWHGLSSATGVNISNAMRLQIPIVSPILSGDSLPEAAGGVFTGLTQKGARAVTAASRGDLYRAIENISPEVLAGGMRAYRMAAKGATTGTGKVIFDENGRPMQYTTGEAVTRMLGFQPSRISERNDLTNVQKGLSAHWKEERGDLLAELRLSKPGRRKEVMLKIMKFNRRLRASQATGLVPAIKTATIRRTLRDKPNKGKSEWRREQLGG